MLLRERVDEAKRFAQLVSGMRAKLWHVQLCLNHCARWNFDISSGEKTGSDTSSRNQAWLMWSTNFERNTQETGLLASELLIIPKMFLYRRWAISATRRKAKEKEVRMTTTQKMRWVWDKIWRTKQRKGKSDISVRHVVFFTWNKSLLNLNFSHQKNYFCQNASSDQVPKRRKTICWKNPLRFTTGVDPGGSAL